MRATPGACIKPGCLARRPLCHKVNLPASCEAQRLLCHKVNLLSCVARRPQCHRVNLPSCEARRPLFHEVNLPRCEARRRPLFHKVKSTEMWGSAAPLHHDLWYFRHWTNEHFSSMLFIRKNVTSPQSCHSSHWNQYTWPNYWKSYWREPHTHSTEGFDDSFETCEIERCKWTSVQTQSRCAGIHHKNVVLGRSLISSQVNKTCQ